MPRISRGKRLTGQALLTYGLNSGIEGFRNFGI